MAIETGSYISDLEPLNPASTDLLKQADDHLRLIKSCIKNTFPNITGPVTVTQDFLNSPPSSIPVGAILLWYGDAAAIPSGFALCDGSLANKSDNSGTIQTPDLRDRIPMGLGTTLATLGAVGGALTDSPQTVPAAAPVTGTTDAVADHSHTPGTLAAAAASVTFGTRTGDYSIVGGNTGPYVISITNPHTHTISGATAVAGGHSHTTSGSAAVPALDVTVNTLPPVLGVNFIMKV